MLGDSTGIPADVKPAQDTTPAQRQSADIVAKEAMMLLARQHVV